jgi:hypothetical protein
MDSKEPARYLQDADHCRDVLNSRMPIIVYPGRVQYRRAAVPAGLARRAF